MEEKKQETLNCVRCHTEHKVKRILDNNYRCTVCGDFFPYKLLRPLVYKIKNCTCYCHKPRDESAAVFDFACGCDLVECLVEESIK